MGNHELSAKNPAAVDEERIVPALRGESVIVGDFFERRRFRSDR
jgi:hypothetical protein